MYKIIRNLLKPYWFKLRQYRCILKRIAIRKKILNGKFPFLNSTNNSQYIVSLTSHGERVNTTAPFAIYSIFLQTVFPSKIILYLNKEKWNDDNLPNLVKKLIEHGLEVRFVQDIGPQTKLVPALNDFSNTNIITVDDDIYYHKKMLEVLILEHKKEESKICCYVVYGKDKRYRVFPIPLGVYGVLYPPNSLHSMATDFKEISAVCPNNDDIWFGAMAKLKGTDFSVINADFYKKGLSYVDLEAEQNGLFNTTNHGDGNKRTLDSVLSRFPEIKANISDEEVE